MTTPAIRPPRPPDDPTYKRIGTDGPGWWAYALIAGVVLAFAFGMVLIIRHADAVDNRHERERAERRVEVLKQANQACGLDRTKDFRVHGRSWSQPDPWYEVICERVNGTVYLRVIGP